MNSTANSPITVEPLTSTIGAKISGVDLRTPTQEQSDAISAALDRYSVLVLPGQDLDLDEQVKFAEVFGPIEPLRQAKFLGLPAVLEIDGLIDANDQRAPTARWVEFPGWHVDGSFAAQIPRAAILRAEIIPPVGGMTAWTNVCAAYEALSPTLREWLKTLQAVHCYPEGYREKLCQTGMTPEVMARFDEEFAPRAHPVVFRHPRSGRCGLFVNPTYTTHIVGLANKESRMLLSFLFNHLDNPQFSYRHMWKQGDVVVWDELATLHLAPDASDYRPHRRRVVRVTAGLEDVVAA